MSRQKTLNQTTMARIPFDLAEMLSWITRLSDKTTAEIIDPLIRPTVEEQFELIRARVEIIKAAESGTLPGHAPELGVAGQ